MYTIPIDEKNYENIMINEVEPYLKSIRKDETFTSFDGKNIHYEAYSADAAKATVVIAHGFTESAEKFREMSYYFLKNNYNVFAIDHRGHGHSYKIPGDPETVRLNKFSDYIEDLHTFISKVVKPASNGLPLYLYSHSMGGGIAALYIEKYNDFDKVIMSAPMICANTGMPIPVAKTVGFLAVLFGQGKTSVPGRCKFNPNATYTHSDETSEARFNYYYYNKKSKNVNLRTCGPSFKWAYEAVKITDIILKDENCKKVKCPVLIFQPETDRQVISEYQNKFVAKIPNGKIIYVPNSKHEIFGSEDHVLEKYLKDIFEFLGSSD